MYQLRIKSQGPEIPPQDRCWESKHGKSRKTSKLQINCKEELRTTPSKATDENYTTTDKLKTKYQDGKDPKHNAEVLQFSTTHTVILFKMRNDNVHLSVGVIYAIMYPVISLLDTEAGTNFFTTTLSDLRGGPIYKTVKLRRTCLHHEGRN